jgi:hypothetical protein
MKRAQPEHALQQKVFVYLRRALPPGSYVTSIDHARKATEAQRLMLRARGVLPGIPDMVVLVAGFPAIWIELKAPSGTASENQIVTAEAIARNGHRCFEARSVDEVEAYLHQMGVPLAERAPTPALTKGVTRKRASKPPVRKPSSAAIGRVEAMRSRTPF